MQGKHTDAEHTIGVNDRNDVEVIFIHEALNFRVGGVVGQKIIYEVFDNLRKGQQIPQQLYGSVVPLS